MARAEPNKHTVVDGVVVTPDGKPLPTARVAGTLEWADSQSTFVVDHVEADGSWKLELAPSSAVLKAIRVTAWASGYSNADYVRTVPRGAKGYKSLRLAMRPTISVEARVIDATTQAPVTTATVTISNDSFSTDHPLEGKPQHVDAAGKVVFAGVNDQDMIDLALEAPGYLPVTWSHVDLAKPIVMTIARGGTFLGRLLDLDTGKPIASCKITSYSGETTTDAQGRFQLQAAYGGVVVVPMCKPYGTDWDLAPSGHLATFAEHDTQVHDFKARKVRPVEVIVVDAKKKPVANLQVTRVFTPKNPYQPIFVKHGPPTEAATTDASGKAVFEESSMDAFELWVNDVSRGSFELTRVTGAITIELAPRKP